MKINKNLLSANLFNVLIFNIFLFGLVFGPWLVNFFIFSLLIIFLKKLKQNELNLIINFDLTIKLQLIFCLYLILNSFFIGDQTSLFLKSLPYFRFFLIAFVISQVLDFKYNTLEYIILSFQIFSVFLGIDVIYQYLFTFDLFGFEAGICSYPEGVPNCERFSGFFGEELIAGNFLSTYGIMFLYLFYSRFSKYKYNKIISLISFLIIICAIILSGERNAVLAVFIILVFNILFNQKNRKKLILFSSIFLLIFASLFISLDNVKYRYFGWPTSYLKSMKSEGSKKFLDTSWGSHYVTAYEIFLNNKLFGSGFKSFRYECRKDEYDFIKLNKKYNLNMIVSGCSSHPHNLYIEVLSELGVTGLILFLLLLYYTILIPFIKNYKYIKNDTEILIVLSIIVTYIFPFRPSGSFSSSVFSTNLWFFIGFYLYFINQLKYKTKKIKE